MTRKAEPSVGRADRLTGALALPVLYAASCGAAAALLLFTGLRGPSAAKTILVWLATLLALPGVFFVALAESLRLSLGRGFAGTFWLAAVILPALGYWAFGGASTRATVKRLAAVWLCLSLLGAGGAALLAVRWARQLAPGYSLLPDWSAPTPLPLRLDNDLIRNFQEHRADFDALLARCRAGGEDSWRARRLLKNLRLAGGHRVETLPDAGRAEEFLVYPVPAGSTDGKGYVYVESKAPPAPQSWSLDLKTTAGDVRRYRALEGGWYMFAGAR